MVQSTTIWKPVIWLEMLAKKAWQLQLNVLRIMKIAAAAAAKSLQSCLTLCNPWDGSPTRLCHPWDPPGKNTGVGCHFLLQCMKVKSESEVAQSCPTLATPWTASYQAPLSMGFSRQEYWSGMPLPSLHSSSTLSLFRKIHLSIPGILNSWSELVRLS